MDNIYWRIRKARAEDEAFCLTCYQQASKNFAYQGIDQWQDNYPNASTFRKDLSEGNSYILEIILGDKIETVGTMYFAMSQDLGYEGNNAHIWSNNLPYGVIHRIALADEFKEKGLSLCFFCYAARQAHRADIPMFRIDTHRDNQIMQSLLQRLGFQNRGAIYFAREDSGVYIQRMAYDQWTESILHNLQSWSCLYKEIQEEIT